MKSEYLHLISEAVAAYSPEHIREYTGQIRAGGMKDHGYARLVANIGFLLAHGERRDLQEYFPEMMDLACSEVLESFITSYESHEINPIGNDFSVRELVLALTELEKAGLYSKGLTSKWRKCLSVPLPLNTYTKIAAVPPERINNWAAYAAASEQTRIAAGMTDHRDFTENQVQSQLLSFDENGMYRDPDEPMLYDLAARLQLAWALHSGYDGEGRKALEEYLDRSAQPTLLMQSVTGEIPFGGRSNQFLFNDTIYAALCEFYAARYKKKGQTELAGQFKSAARLACESAERWLAGEKRHIKNRFPADSGLGCEGYGYFDKYMATMGSWSCMAYAFADGEIDEYPCPAMQSGHVFATSEHFHKLFLQAAGYTAEFDLNADPHYDASGLGRLHKAGVPSALCLSVPFAVKPKYKIPECNPSPLSISPCSFENGTAQIPERWEIESYYGNGRSTEARLRSALDGRSVSFALTLSAEGAQIASDASVAFPLFVSDGEERTEIREDAGRITVSYHGSKATYSADEFIRTDKKYYNRNGIYELAIAGGGLKITLE